MTVAGPTASSRRNVLALAALGATRVALGFRSARAEDIIPPGFRDEVLALLREAYPDRPFAPDPGNGAAVTLGKTRLFLGNLYAYVTDAPPDRRRADILRWFAQNLAILDKAAADAAKMKVWANAVPHVRAQLVPRVYLDTRPDLLHANLSRNILIISVIDYPDRTDPIRAEMLTGWGIPHAKLRTAAIANLEEISRAVPIALHEASGTRGRYALISTGDAYDAARILLPSVRQRLVDKLGAGTVAAAVPNRDALVAWPRKEGDQRDLVAELAAARPYPLSNDVFEIDADGVRQAGEGAR